MGADTASFENMHDDHNTSKGPLAAILVYVRSLLFQIYLVFVTLMCGLIGLPLILLGEDALRGLCQFWCRAVLGGLKLICGVDYHVSGLEHIPQEGAVIAANHQSMWETLMLYAVLKKPVMVLKQELLRIPLFGLWLRLGGCIAIDRSAGSKAMRLLLSEAKKSTRNGGQIIIFPEGTRMSPGEVTSLKPGIAGIYNATNVACLVAGHDSGRYWKTPGFLKLPGKVRLNISELIPSGFERKEFMTLLNERMMQMRPDITSIDDH